MRRPCSAFDTYVVTLQITVDRERSTTPSRWDFQSLLDTGEGVSTLSDVRTQKLMGVDPTAMAYFNECDDLDDDEGCATPRQLFSYVVLWGQHNESFVCEAEDANHALEQCADAYPNEQMISIIRGRIEVPS